MRAWRDMEGDLFEVHAHGLAVATGHDDARVLALDGNIDAPPDRGVGIGKRDANPGDGLGHAAMLTGAASAVQFQGISSSQREAGHPLAIFSITSAI